MSIAFNAQGSVVEVHILKLQNAFPVSFLIIFLLCLKYFTLIQSVLFPKGLH